MGALDRILKRGRLPAGLPQSPIAKMLAELRKFGANGHLYIPGVGAINGITAGNYLDSIGTTPASVDGLVGLVLDGAGSVGAELVNNGSFSGATGWSLNAGTGTASISGGAANVLSPDGSFVSIYANPQFTIKIGSTYSLEFEVTQVTGAGPRIDFANVTGTAQGSVGRKRVILTAVGAGALSVVRGAGAGSGGSITNISVKEITGIHASQATTGNKPKLRRGLVNLLLYSNDLMNAAWSITSGGTKQSANSITFSATNDQLGQTVNTDASVGVSATGAVILSGAGSIVLVLARSGGGVYEDSMLTINLTPTPTLYTVSKTIANAGQTGFRLALVKTAGSTATSITMDGAALLKGSLTAQQIIAAGGIPLTTTAAASSSGGAYKWEFDGVDDSMSLGVVPFQMSDDHCVIAMGNNLAGSGARYIIDFGSAGSANPICGSVGFSNSAVVAQWRDDAGTANLLSGGGIPLGTQAVVTARKVGNSFSLRANGAQVLANLATLSTTTLTGGKIGVRVFGSNLYQGVISGVVVIKGTVSDAQALIFERGLNALSQYAAGRF